MMRHQLADIAARGEPVAALLASESVIYGRYGYGCASSQLSLTIRRGEGALNQAAAGSGYGRVRLQAAQPADLRTELARVYDRTVPQRPGMMARDERWWQSILADPESHRRGMSALKCLLAGDDSGPRGYALDPPTPQPPPASAPKQPLTSRSPSPRSALATWAAPG